MSLETIDLHGMTYDKAEHAVHVAAYRFDTPFRIITGNSAAMLEVAKKVLNHYELRHEVENDYNLGSIIVYTK